MYWETLPGWIWMIYNGFLAATFLTALIRIVRRKKFMVEIIVLVLVFLIPVIGILNSATSIRLIEQNEYEFFLSQLQQGALWTFFSIAGYCVILIWWGRVLLGKRVTSTSFILKRVY